MTQTIYGLNRDNGDGSASIVWFKDLALVNRLLDQDDRSFPSWVWESYSMNDCGPSLTLCFPDDLDLESCGFRFSDQDILSYEITYD